jgi:hypothetical protein
MRYSTVGGSFSFGLRDYVMKSQINSGVSLNPQMTRAGLGRNGQRTILARVLLTSPE